MLSFGGFHEVLAFQNKENSSILILFGSSVFPWEFHQVSYNPSIKKCKHTCQGLCDLFIISKDTRWVNPIEYVHVILVMAKRLGERNVNIGMLTEKKKNHNKIKWWGITQQTSYTYSLFHKLELMSYYWKRNKIYIRRLSEMFVLEWNYFKSFPPVC